MVKRLAVGVLILVMLMSWWLPATAEEGQICGEPETFTFWAAKTIDIGTITVWNDAEQLYVRYDTTGDWWMIKATLYAVDYEPTERLDPAVAPYQALGLYTQSFTFVVPLAELVDECGTALWFQAHAGVLKVMDGKVVLNEAAYGGTINPYATPWYGNIAYRVQCCEEPPVCYEFMEETAWTAGERYVSRGNWATYTAYVADSTADLYAGQNMLAGTVHFSAPEDGYVTLTINLTGDWEFAPTDENVKIQDYEFAPSGNPAPGQFPWKGTASGQSFAIEVPWNNFYGVHVDVGTWVEVPCPLD